MWYVLEVGTEETIAITRKREVAEVIATQVAEKPCVIRYSVR